MHSSLPSHAQVQAHAREAAHPFWLFQEDIQLRGKVYRFWRADIPRGQWVATGHDCDPNGDKGPWVVSADDRDGLLIALRKLA